MPEPMKEQSVKQEEPKPVMKSKKPPQQSYRQKLQAVQARIKYREKAIKGFRHHLERGTFPKRIKSLKPYPKMSTSEAQALVNAACQQAECVVLDQMILAEDLKLKEDQHICQALKEERNLSQIPRKSKMLTVIQLQQELTDLQAKYSDLCRKMENQTVTGL